MKKLLLVYFTGLALALAFLAGCKNKDTEIATRTPKELICWDQNEVFMRVAVSYVGHRDNRWHYNLASDSPMTDSWIYYVQAPDTSCVVREVGFIPKS